MKSNWHSVTQAIYQTSTLATVAKRQVLVSCLLVSPYQSDQTNRGQGPTFENSNLIDHVWEIRYSITTQNYKNLIYQN